MWQALAGTVRRLIDDLYDRWRHGVPASADLGRESAARPLNFGPLKRVTLTDEVCRTLFEEFAQHRQGERGEEETGWVLLGLRKEDEAVILATLPAGMERQASAGHVRFNSAGQAVGSRIVRQMDRRLVPLGVVHTHPGSLRHPSDGDYRGDSPWVGRLRGGEGIFGIGTADGKSHDGEVFAIQPKANVQCLGDLRMSWYSLRKGDRNYRPVPYTVTIGPDLAKPLHPVWPTVEAFADQLDRLFSQQSGAGCEVVMGKTGPALAVKIPLAERHEAVHVLLDKEGVRYYFNRNGEMLAADLNEPRVDRGVYLLLAELAAR